jgi:cysteinyl-tRNA synthetase
MHGQFLLIDGSKVSKSKGDDLSIPGIIAKGYDPLDLRYFYMTGHYRSFLSFTRDALSAAAKTRQNLIKKLAAQLTHEDIVEFDSFVPGSLYIKLAAYMADDLDTVSLLSALHTGASGSSEHVIDILLFDQEVSRL